MVFVPPPTFSKNKETCIRITVVKTITVINEQFCFLSGYVPIRTPARKLTATPTPMAGTPMGFRMQTPDNKVSVVDMQPKGNLPLLKPDDMQYFDKLLVSFSNAIMAFYKRDINENCEFESDSVLCKHLRTVSYTYLELKLGVKLCKEQQNCKISSAVKF